MTIPCKKVETFVTVNMLEQGEEQISSPFGKLALQTPQTQKLRSRTHPKEPAVPSITEKVSSFQKKTHNEKMKKL